MKKLTKIMLAAAISMTALAGTGCSSADKPAASSQADQAVLKSAYAAALMAEDKFSGLFEKKDGLDGDKAVSYMVPSKTGDDAVAFLSSISWDKEVAKKQFESVLGDKALLDKANKALEAKAKADKKTFKPVAAVADTDKLGKNVLTGAKFEDVKVTEKDGKYTIEYKGLTYTVQKSGDSYKVVGKEGQLQK